MAYNVLAFVVGLLIVVIGRNNGMSFVTQFVLALLAGALIGLIRALMEDK